MAAELVDVGVSGVTNVSNGNGKTTREFQWLVGGALAICLGIQAFLMWSLLTAQPPDSSWKLIEALMSHLGQVDVLLIGGLLGMATPKKG